MSIDVADNGDDTATLSFAAADSGTAPQPGVYATSSDLAGLYPQTVAPANVDAQLRFASRLVRRATATAIYDTLTDGFTPSDPGVAEAFTEAVCAQVSAWVEAGVDPFTGGLQKTGSVISSKSLDGKSIGYDNSLNASVTAFQERKAMIDGLVPEAVMILQDALCGTVRPWVRG